jgi:hypothetical protein
MIEALEEVMDQCNGTRLNLFEENKQALTHTHHFFFKPLIKWEDKVEESRLTRSGNRRRG